MGDIIKLLPDNISNQIAAGEVIQRPASVVKELMENSIDANASKIKLIIKESGKTLIQVVDDGIGMSPTDARLSFERHSTSKLKQINDLFKIKTNGFRGEALASISSVSKVEMKTKLMDEKLGTIIKIENNKIKSQDPIGMNTGTSISVKNLFFNVPARRNFLKNNSIELRHIVEEFIRISLAHSNKRFVLHSNKKILYNLIPSNTKYRISNIFGKKIIDKIIPISEETDIIKINGYISKPEFAKLRNNEKYFFVNKRFIKSQYLNSAVNKAFDNLILKEKFPSYFIFMDIDPKHIDINIHPTKTEIKFENEREIYTIILSIIKHALGKHSIIPAIDFDEKHQLPKGYINREPKMPTIEVDRDFNPFKDEDKTKVSKEDVNKWNQLNDQAEEIDLKLKKLDSNIFDVDIEKINQERIFESEINKIKFQIFKKYILVLEKDEIIFIHQARAHQRIIYEKYLGQSKSNSVSQKIMFPINIILAKQKIILIKSIKKELNRLGFDINITEDSILIKAIPSNLEENNIEDLIEDLVEDLNLEENIKDLEDKQKSNIFYTITKHCSVKTGDVLDDKIIGEIVNGLFSCKNPSICPLGKSTFIKMSMNKIDNMFLAK